MARRSPTPVAPTPVAPTPVALAAVAPTPDVPTPTVELRFSVVDPGRPGARCTVEVRCPAGTVLAELARPLAAAVGAETDRGSPPPTLWLAGTDVSDLVVGWPPLLDGATLAVGPAGPPGSEPPAGPPPLQPRARPDGRGHLVLSTGPLLVPASPQVTVTFPTEPAAPTGHRPPWLAAAAPIVVAGLLWLWWRQSALLLVALVSPATVLGQHLLERRTHRREHRRATADWARLQAQAEATLAAELDRESVEARAALPGPAEVLSVACRREERLWRCSDPGAGELTVRVGSGRLPARVRVTGAPRERPELAEVPIGLDLAATAVIGVVGERAAVLAVARWTIGQLVTRHSPRRLRLVVLVDTHPHDDTGTAAEPALDHDGAWDWVGRLPHAERGGARSEPGEGSAPVRLVVLDGAARLRRRPEVVGWLAGGAGSRTTVVCLERELDLLPEQCRAAVVLDGDRAELRIHGRGPQAIRPDLPDPAWAASLAEALAPLRDDARADEASALPPPSLTLLLARDGDADPLDQDAVRRRWAASVESGTASLAVPLGTASDGRPWRPDLVTQGPHALVAGTTGAGKSHLLTCWLVALAALTSPRLVNLLLIDYKGAASFGPLASLPHVSGLLSDLDPQQGMRAVRSLRAEVRRRERVLARCGVADVAALPPAQQIRQGVPRLVLVVDEFRVLAEEAPEFLAGLLRVAAVGRALGLHLILATQRPAGVVGPELRANLTLRMALRVRDAAESTDVIDVPDAARLAPEPAGLGLARSGNGPVTRFRTAALPAPQGVGRPELRRVRRRPDEPTRWEPDDDNGAPATPATAAPSALAGLPALVHAIVGAATAEGAGPARPVWQPPLPSRLPWAALPSDDPPSACPDVATCPDTPAEAPDDPGSGRLAGHRPALVRFALADLPDSQRRRALSWALEPSGHLAVVGAPGSGRTTALQAVACGCGELERRAPGTVALHAIGSVDGLAALTAVVGSPLLGTLARTDDLELVERLADRLTDLLTGTAPPHRFTVVLLDGWDEAVDTWSVHDHGRLTARWLGLARDLAGKGLRLAISGGRGALLGAPAGLWTERLLLRPVEPADLAIAGIPASSRPQRMPPGRGLALGPALTGSALDATSGPVPVEVQIARPAALGDAGHPVPAAPRLIGLPTRVALADLLAAIEASPGAPCPGTTGRSAVRRQLPLGMGGDTASPVGLDTGRHVGPLAAVLGRPGSGRSTVLRTAATVLAASGRPTLSLTGHSPPTPAELLDQLDAHPAAVLLADDAHGLTGTELEAAVLARLSPGRARGRWPAGPGPSVLVAGAALDALAAPRGLLAAAVRGRSAVILAAGSAAELAALGTGVPALPPGPPGRGAVGAPRQRWTPVQIATPP